MARNLWCASSKSELPTSKHAPRSWEVTRSHLKTKFTIPIRPPLLRALKHLEETAVDQLPLNFCMAQWKNSVQRTRPETLQHSQNSGNHCSASFFVSVQIDKNKFFNCPFATVLTTGTTDSALLEKRRLYSISTISRDVLPITRKNNNKKKRKQAHLSTHKHTSPKGLHRRTNRCCQQGIRGGEGKWDRKDINM